ncbi:Uncharacterized conserved protein TEX2, contains PH domain [Phaffia rhodozyma]|uniref:Uncharacterized conserved protein TEX2, contains PH domain n=1 Tax=Phaffia rhodozyma TaxID=264483 RepID=A0A0F7SE51_PHARH|nr:Uncharacterized conserved protein TEX2, contains PH domain [Phaffia rhodozyma]
MGVFTHLFAFILGGLTLIPLLIFGIFVWTSVPVGDPHPSKIIKNAIEKEALLSGHTTKPGAISTSKDIPASGVFVKSSSRLSNWLTVRRSFSPYPSGASENPKPAKETSSDNSYSALLLRTVRSSASQASNTAPVTGSTSSTPSNSSSTGGSTSASVSQYKPPSDFKFCCLKGTTLFLYEDQDQSECYAVLNLQHLKVTIFPDDLKDAEMFAKRNCIKLSSLNEEEKLDRAGAGEKKGSSSSLPYISPWYIFVKESSLMEDWYLALKHASSRNPQVSVLDQLSPVFSQKDMAYLIEKLDTDPDPIPMRWLNGMFGRFFLGIHRTALLEDVIISKIHKKLGRLQLPSFLSPLKVSSVEIKSPPPTFSKPMLRDLTKEGEASMEVAVCWMGEVRIKVGTEVSLTLVGRVLRVSVVLDLVIKEIEGNLLLMIKSPPSSRVWYGFTKEPKMVINVEPVVSSTHIKWSMILKPIEKQIREGIIESVVLPNMDDINWFDSSAYPNNRGAVFAEAARNVEDPALPAPSPIETTTDEATLIDTKNTDAMPGGLRKRPASVISGEFPVEEEADSGGSTPVTPSDGSLHRSASTSIKRNWFGNKTNGSGDSNKKPVAVLDEGTVKAVPISSSSSIILDEFYQPSSETSTIPLKASSASTGRLSTESLPAQVGSTRAPIFNPALPQSEPVRPRTATLPMEDRTLKQPHASKPVTVPESTSPARSTTSLVSNWKARANNVDKQAISTSLNQAKDVAKRWGANWAAKRKVVASTGSNEAEGLRGAQPVAGRGHQSSLSLGQMPTDLFNRFSSSKEDKLESASSSRTDLSRSYPPINPAPRNFDEDSDKSVPPTARHVAPSSADSIVSNSLPVPPQLPKRDRSPSLRSKPTSPHAQDPKKKSLMALPSGAQATVKLQTDSAPAGAHTTVYEEGVNRRAAPVRTQMSASPMMTIPRIPLSRKADVMAFGSTDENKEPIGQKDKLSSIYKLFPNGNVGSGVSPLSTDETADRSSIEESSNILTDASAQAMTDDRPPLVASEVESTNSAILASLEASPLAANTVISPAVQLPIPTRSRTFSSDSITSSLSSSLKASLPPSAGPVASAGRRRAPSVSSISSSTPSSPIALSGTPSFSFSTRTAATITDDLQTRAQSVSSGSSLESGSQLSGSLSKAEETLWGIARRDRERGVAQVMDPISNETTSGKVIYSRSTSILAEISDDSTHTSTRISAASASPSQLDRSLLPLRDQSDRMPTPDLSSRQQSQFSTVSSTMPSDQLSIVQDGERESLELRPGLGTRSRSVSETNSLGGMFRFDEH